MNAQSPERWAYNIGNLGKHVEEEGSSDDENSVASS